MKLATWRKLKGLSQADLAETLGLSNRVSVARYEGGRKPDAEVLQKIIDVTEGAVTANDWFDVPAASARETA